MRIKNLEEVYIFQLEKAYKQFRKYKNTIFKKEQIDLTSDQWILLKGISEKEGISQIDLAKQFFKEPASVTRILDILERKEFVTRRELDNNRRVYALYTTDRGKQLIQRVLPIARSIRAKGLEGLSEEEQNMLLHLLSKLFENFKG